MGVLNISLDDLKLLSVSDIYRALHWKQYYESKSRETQYQNSWEQTRVISTYAAGPYLEKKVNNFSDLFPLEWDQAKPEITKEEREKQAAQRAKWDAQMIANAKE